MHRQIRQIDPGDIVAGVATEDYTPRAAATAEWELILDGPSSQSGPQARRAVDRGLCLVVALMGAIAGFGLAGAHPSDVDRVGAGDSPDAPVALTSPAVGATIEGATVAFRATVRTAPGTVSVAAIVGGILIGRTTVTTSSTGPISGAVRVFAPPTRTQVQLVATVDQGGGSAGDITAVAPGRVASRRAVTLRPTGPVGTWPVEVVATGGHTIVVVSGCAPLGVGHVTVRATTPGGDPVAAVVVAVGPVGEVDGSSGGASLGLGGFVARLALPDSVPAGSLRVEVAWRDEFNGSWGSSWLPVTAR